jgi:hypothetical protein
MTEQDVRGREEWRRAEEEEGECEKEINGRAHKEENRVSRGDGAQPAVVLAAVHAAIPAFRRAQPVLTT